MKKKMAEITLHMECGGKIITYFPVKSEKDLLKKLKKSRKDESLYDFGHVWVDDAAVTFAEAKLHVIN